MACASVFAGIFVSVVIISDSGRTFILFGISIVDDKSADFNGMLSFEISKIKISLRKSNFFFFIYLNYH
jgi:hypothetical protein